MKIVDHTGAPQHTRSDIQHGRSWSGGAHLRTFAIVMVVLMTAFTIAVFSWIGVRTEALLSADILEQSRSYADLIVAARSWNANHGGVYVMKSETVTTNPFLIELGVEPDDVLSDGTPVTLRNPAAMTREIGDYLEIAKAAAVFKITSLEPVNPSNAPDEWETAALEAMAVDGDERWTTEQPGGDAPMFRYMRPLFVDESCLSCHSRDDYAIGDVRGALSVSLPQSASTEALAQNRIELLSAGALVLLGLWAAVLGLLAWLRAKLRHANERLEHLATVDALTGLWNRQHTLERLRIEMERTRRMGHSTGVVIVDLDHFKRVNDTFGHAAGDEVLRLAAGAMTQAVRSYDTVGRIGGEELLVVAPDVDASQLAVLGERIRAGVEGLVLPAAFAGYGITVSVGTALVGADAEETADMLVARADAALFTAKNAGRNRVAAG